MRYPISNSDLLRQIVSSLHGDGANWSDYPCVEWPRGRNDDGYGVLRIYGAMRPAHRTAYELSHQISVPATHMVCHHCDNPPCIRPSHLFLGTNLDNFRDSIRKGRDAYTARCRRMHTQLPIHQVPQVAVLHNLGFEADFIAKVFGVSLGVIIVELRRIRLSENT